MVITCSIESDPRRQIYQTKVLAARRNPAWTEVGGDRRQAKLLTRMAPEAGLGPLAPSEAQRNPDDTARVTERRRI
jgi:hypothetical protein